MVDTKFETDCVADQVSPPSVFAHIVLKTSRMQEMRDWYCKVLNAQVVFEGPHAAFLTYDDEHHRIALVQVPDLVAPHAGSTGLDHFAFNYRELGTLLSNYRVLKAAGIEPRWCVNHRSTTSFYYEDPDRNRIEFSIENYASAEELKSALNSTNGRKPTCLFDPEALIAAYERGEPLESFRDGDFGGPSAKEILAEMGLARIWPLS